MLGASMILEQPLGGLLIENLNENVGSDTNASVVTLVNHDLENAVQ